jgi:hypothetical protein
MVLRYNNRIKTTTTIYNIYIYIYIQAKGRGYKRLRSGRIYQHKTVNANYVIDRKLEMNAFISLNVIISIKKVSSHFQIIL